MVNRILLLIVYFINVSFASIAQTEVIKICRQKTFPKKLPAGNYSGITHISGNEYAVVSDKSETDGFFIFNIEIDPVSGEITDIRNLGFRGDNMKTADCEGIVYVPSTSTFFISREADNVIAEYTLEGKATGRKLNIPKIYMEGIYRNHGFESLTYDKQTGLFWTINESPLTGDGECANSLNGVCNILRLQSFGEDLQPEQQFFYKMDVPVASSKSDNYVMGVSEILSVGNGRLIVLEREFFVPKIKLGAFVNCKFYEIKPEKEFAIEPGERVSDGIKFLPKRNICYFVTKLGLFNRSLANYEGMCLGPVLDDGSKTIILVSDSQNRYAGVLKDWFKTIVIR